MVMSYGKMIKFKVNLKNLDKGKRLTKDKIKKILMKSMFKMEELSVDKAPVDQSYLRQNITLFPQILAAKYYLVSKALYSAAMEYGTRPYYAPIKPLAEWAKRKLGDESLAYAIQAKIAREGITAQPFMRPSFHEVSTYWVYEFAKQEFKNSSI